VGVVVVAERACDGAAGGWRLDRGWRGANGRWAHRFLLSGSPTQSAMRGEAIGSGMCGMPQKGICNVEARVKVARWPDGSPDLASDDGISARVKLKAGSQRHSSSEEGEKGVRVLLVGACF
jgi:hypothetical protein